MVGPVGGGCPLRSTSLAWVAVIIDAPSTTWSILCLVSLEAIVLKKSDHQEKLDLRAREVVRSVVSLVEGVEWPLARTDERRVCAELAELYREACSVLNLSPVVNRESMTPIL